MQTPVWAAAGLLLFANPTSVGECGPSAPDPVREIAEIAHRGASFPQAAPLGPGEFALAAYNVQNFYDAYDDPRSENDHPSNPGSHGVRKPFNYLPRDESEYRLRLRKIAMGIASGLLSPDVVLIVEAEGQDDCSDGGSAYGRCGSPDGIPDVLQDLAEEIRRQGGADYRVATDLRGNSPRGIMQAFLYRADRVELVEPVKALNGVASAAAQADGLGAELFDRPPQFARFRIWPGGVGTGRSSEVYVSGNHFKSRPNDFIVRRSEQAKFNADLAAELLREDPAANVLVMGDLNSPDESQFAALHATGTLVDLIGRLPEEDRHTYDYRGRLQVLDRMYASPALQGSLSKVESVHLNTMREARAKRRDPHTPVGASDHDPIRAKFTIPE